MSTQQPQPAAGNGLPVVHRDANGKPVPPWPRPVDLLKLPREVRDEILAASAELMEEEYRANKDLTDFEAFAEEP
jgi:hypothetical protein